MYFQTGNCCIGTSRVDEWEGVPDEEGNITLKIKESSQTEASGGEKKRRLLDGSEPLVAIGINLAVIKNIHHHEGTRGEKTRLSSHDVTQRDHSHFQIVSCRHFSKILLKFFFWRKPQPVMPSHRCCSSERGREKFCFCFFSLSSPSHIYHQREGLFPFGDLLYLEMNAVDFYTNKRCTKKSSLCFL